LGCQAQFGHALLVVINGHIAPYAGEERKRLVVMGKAVPLRGSAEGHGRTPPGQGIIGRAMRLQLALVREIPKIEFEG